jgi:hypothetical protein
MHPFIHASMHPPIHPSIHPSIHPLTHPTAHLPNAAYLPCRQLQVHNLVDISLTGAISIACMTSQSRHLEGHALALLTSVSERPGGEATLPPLPLRPSRTMTCMIMININSDTVIMQAPAICPGPQALARHLLAKPPRPQPPLSVSLQCTRAYPITRRPI